MLTLNHQSNDLYNLLSLLLQRDNIVINYEDKSDPRNAFKNLFKNYRGKNLYYIVYLLLKHGFELKDLSGNMLAVLFNNKYQLKHEINLYRLVELILTGHQSLGASIFDMENDRNALMKLCFNYHGDNLIDIIRLLLNAGIDVNFKTKNGWNSMLALCSQQYGHKDFFEIIKLLIDHGIDINFTNPDGVNCLIALCERYEGDGFLEIVNLLIERGIQVNALTSQGWNALFSLCFAYQGPDINSIIQRLLDAGINVNAKTNDHWNSLLALLSQQANRLDLVEVSKLLIDHQVDLKTGDDKGRNALIVLCARYNNKGTHLSEMFSLLIEHGINLNHVDSDGKNILHHLFENYPLETISKILENLDELKNIDRKLEDKFGRKPYDYYKLRKQKKN